MQQLPRHDADGNHRLRVGILHAMVDIVPLKGQARANRRTSCEVRVTV